MITDVNVNLSRWPFRRLPHDETSKLVKKLRTSGITRAWASSFDGIFHQDVSAVNERIAIQCKEQGDGILVPFGCINPMLPDWQEDFRRCDEEHGMPGIRLHPNYHGYTLEDPVFEELLAEAERTTQIVQLVMKMEDERTQHRLVRVPTVDTKPLAEIVKRHPKLHLVILNGMKTLRGDAITDLVQAGEVYFDISMQEGVGGIEKMLKLIPLERVLFGSHFPFFYLEAAILKLKESNLGRFREEAIMHANATKLLKR